MKHIFFLLLILGSLFIVSCGDKEGCTDPSSENYDPDAIFDDGSCVTYNRTQYYADYLGEFRCENPIFTERLDNDSLMFSISEPVEQESAFAVILTLIIDQIPVNLDGVIDGNTLIIDDTLPNFTLPDFPIDGVSTTVNIIGLGNAVFSDDGQRMEGPLTLTLQLTDGSGSFEDTCILVGMRQ